VQKIIVNDTIHFLFKTASSISVISNHNGFRVLFVKIASVYFISKIYLYFSVGMARPANCANCIGALSFPIHTGAVLVYEAVWISSRSRSRDDKLFTFLQFDVICSSLFPVARGLLLVQK